MTLYKMEIYKICHRKIFVVFSVCVIAILLFAFGMQVLDEEATIDGVRYIGYRAVQINRQITEEFKGVLTDEKVEKIAEKYGFPHKVESGWNHFRDENFLTQFVLEYDLSDGYMRSENDYRVGKKTCPIADSSLGAVIELSGKEIILEYYHGWTAFLEVLAISMVMGSILVLLSLSIIFANERQTKMLPLIFTTVEGRKTDIHAKVAAAFTITTVIWTVIFLLDLSLCGIVYGFDGLNCYNGMVVYLNYLLPWPERMIPMYYYVLMAVVLSLFGFIFLCAITICISARCKSSFHAVAVAAACFGGPVLAAMFTDGFVGIGKILAAAPVFMVIYSVVDKIYDIWLMPVGVAAVMSVICVLTAYRKYNGQQGF
ncbi:MAG: ABC transporter permease [Lachnospiraceae bacterium]|nr:ABC transporter permease [Lachnospiraceae bacterium]